MSTQPPWMDDDTPPWEIDDTAGDAPERFGREQMAKLGQSPSTGFAGTTSARDHLSAIEAAEPPGPGDPRFYGDPNDIESLKQAGQFRGEVGAAPYAAATLAAPAIIPVSKAAAVRAGWGLVGGTAGTAGGTALGALLERGPFPAGTAKALGIAGGLVGGGLGGIRGRKGVDQIKDLWNTIRGGGQSEKVKRAVWEARMRDAAEAKGAKDVMHVEEQFLRAQEGARKKASVARAVGPRKGQTTMATNLGGKAKPGPPPTPPDELEAALQASLKGPRVRIGAEKVGRSMGTTKEQVRQQTGPVMDEALGEASPILPREVLGRIVDTMRKIPPAEREAYVARATAGKTKWQTENLRRTLEHLGLLVPAGVAANELGGGDGW